MKTKIEDMTQVEIEAEFFVRPDLLVDMKQAAVDVAKEQDFVPVDQDQHLIWMQANMISIHERFKEIHTERLAKYIKHEKEIKRVLSYQVWREIRLKAGLPVDN